MLLKNKNAVITGCNKGIGKKVLEVFSANQANIFACVRNTKDDFVKFTSDLQKRYNNKIYIIKLDLSNETNLKTAAQEIVSKNIPIHMYTYIYIYKFLKILTLIPLVFLPGARFFYWRFLVRPKGSE